jgi:hypothetical protein
VNAAAVQKGVTLGAAVAAAYLRLLHAATTASAPPNGSPLVGAMYQPRCPCVPCEQEETTQA